MYKKDETTFWLGDKQVFIDPDENITIDGYDYGHTRGLWNFLMLNDPYKFKSTEKDERDYLDIAKRTSLFNYPRIEMTSSNGTAKFKWLKKRENSENIFQHFNCIRFAILKRFPEFVLGFFARLRGFSCRRVCC